MCILPVAPVRRIFIVVGSRDGPGGKIGAFTALVRVDAALAGSISTAGSSPARESVDIVQNLLQIPPEE